MLVPIILFIISFFLDGILSNFLPYMVGDLSFFTPMLTIVSLVVLYPFFTKKLKIYFVSCFLLGLCYDFMYTNMLFYNAILFLMLGLLSTLVYRYIQVNWFSILLFVFIMIVGYECMNAIIILVFNLVPMTFYRLLYKIGHSLLLNLLYGELLYFIILLLPKKYKKIAINSWESRIFAFFFSYLLLRRLWKWIQEKQ